MRHSADEHRGDAEYAPHDRVFEEARVEERVEKQDEEAGGEPQAEDAVAPEGLPEQPRGPGKEREVEDEADGSELGEDRQRRRVRRVLRGAAARLELLLRRERLAADPDACDGVIPRSRAL